jgi:hypothetical protein
LPVSQRDTDCDDEHGSQKGDPTEMETQSHYNEALFMNRIWLQYDATKQTRYPP